MTATDPGPAYDAVRRDGVLRVGRSERGADATDTETETEATPETEWLSTGWNGGRRAADCAYNVSVPDGWERTDLAAYVDERLERAGFDRLSNGDGDGGIAGGAPVLLTGVDLENARGARCGSVTVYATAGISNPAALPMDPDASRDGERDGTTSEPESELESELESESGPGTGTGTGIGTGTGTGTGTVNLIVGTTRTLAPGALANLIAVAAEAKAATLLAETGLPGTTTDAIVVGHDPTGSPAEFSGAGTDVGAAARACVRDAVRASLRARYRGGDAQPPDSVGDAAYGVSTDARADVFRVPESAEQGN